MAHRVHIAERVQANTDSSDKSIIDVFDNSHYAQLAYDNRLNYENNTPYPHIVFDDFLPINIARKISDGYPDVNNINAAWKYHNNKNTIRYFLEDTRQFSKPLKSFATAITSRSFLLFLETLTGVKALLPDPYFMGGGAMVTTTGGYLNVHIDFNWNQKIQAWRRMTVLFYMTPGWQEDWGGNLELWSTDGKSKVKEIVPLFNRLVVFNTTSESYHGQSVPISSPENKPRTVFAAFYYATEKGEKAANVPHYTVYNTDDYAQQAVFESSPYAEQITNDYLKDVKK
ncbi:MAG: 2OG-Fe(II) oxygenase [Methylococcales bacterium]|nr:2OG-Fe(II) oxygenase [Methylococcales bacterium]